MLKLYNTLSRKIEEFKPIGALPSPRPSPRGRGGKMAVRLYTCGPTVYDFAHIGNLRTYIFEDILHRVLEYNGYQVDHAMNITDVGHLVGDGDDGEDKLDKSRRNMLYIKCQNCNKNTPTFIAVNKESFKTTTLTNSSVNCVHCGSINTWNKEDSFYIDNDNSQDKILEIARKYEKKFFDDLAELNIIKPNKILRATDSIKEQIEIITILAEKGFAYKGQQAVYFNTLEYESRFHGYEKLSGQKLSEKKTGAREDVIVDKDKKHPQDFALWFFLVGRYQKHILHWPSPWGEGFPGWHIECSAISRKLLGQPFDVHCGGVDHIGTHHTNEIAQSEAAFDTPLANVWMHGEFLLIDGGRMGKSEGNLFTLDELKKRGFSPLDYRYMCLQAHYRTQLNFTWEALLSAKTALEKLHAFSSSAKAGRVGCAGFEQEFLGFINDDLNIPQALALAWKLIDDEEMPREAKVNSLLKFDNILGLNLQKPFEQNKDSIEGMPGKFVFYDTGTSQVVIGDLKTSARARAAKDFDASDEIRKKLDQQGYEVMDTPQGPKVKRKPKV